MQNCLGEQNLIYCLICLDDIIMFSWTTEEHLHQLCIVFDQFWEYNLKLKPSKCSLFKEKINYLVHQVSKQGVKPSDSNLKAIAECVTPQTYMDIWRFVLSLASWATTGNSSRILLESPSHWMDTLQERELKVWMGVTVGGWLRSLPDFEAGLHEHPHPCLHQLHQGVPTWNRCF